MWDNQHQKTGQQGDWLLYNNYKNQPKGIPQTQKRAGGQRTGPLNLQGSNLHRS